MQASPWTRRLAWLSGLCGLGVALLLFAPARWVTDAITNSFLSDLLPQFTLSLTHDLWRGDVGTEILRRGDELAT